MTSVRRLLALLLVPVFVAGCGSDEAARERPLTDEQLVLMSSVFLNNHTDKGAVFTLTTVDVPGGRTITLDGQVDWVNHQGYATVTGGAVPHPVTQVVWGQNLVAERRPSAAAILEKQMGRPIEFVVRPVDTEHRRLDAIIATLTAMSMKTPENVQILRQKEGSAFLREDELRGTKVLVMRYGARVILWIDPETGRLMRFEGNNSQGTMPIIVDVNKRVVPEIPSPKDEFVATHDELGGTFLQIAPTSP